MRTNRFTKLFIGLLFVLAISCETDETNVQLTLDENQELQLLDIKITKLSVDKKFTIPNDVINQFEKLENKKALTFSRENQSEQINIDTLSGIQIRKGDYESYTFPIIQEEPTNGFFKNLLVSKQSDNSYKSFIISCQLDEEEQLAVLNGEPIALVHKMQINEIDYSIDHLYIGKDADKQSEIRHNDDGTCDEIVETTGPLGFPIQQVIQDVPCDGGGGKSGGTSGSNGSGFSGSGGYGSGTSTGGSTGNENNNPPGGGGTGSGSGSGQNGNIPAPDILCVDCTSNLLSFSLNFPAVLKDRMGYSPWSQEGRWINKQQNWPLVEEMVIFLSRNQHSNAAKERIDDMIDGFNDNTTLSAFPYVKYPKDKAAEYRRDYPKLTEYLKNQLPKIADNPTIVNAFKKFTNMTDAQVKETLTWGGDNSPEIVIEQLEERSGKFEEPNIIKIDIDLVNFLENAESGSEFSEKVLFSIAVTILHEAVHFGDFTYNDDFYRGNNPCSNEEGWLFEQEVYDIAIEVGSDGSLTTLPLPLNCN